jgi:hypothetical protein
MKRRYSRHEIAIYRPQVSLAQILGARSEKTDIDWF